MLGTGASRLIAFVIICSGAEAQHETNFAALDFRGRNSSGFVSEVTTNSTGIENSSKIEYSVENRDFVDVAEFERGKNKNSNSVGSGRSPNGRIVINKCCRWNFYFDIDALRCVRRQANETEVLSHSVVVVGNQSSYLFSDGMVDCGNELVMTFRAVTEVRVDPFGVSIEGVMLGKYCVDEYLGGIFVVVCVRPESFCENHGCFRKCCPVGESYAVSGRKCNTTNSSFNPDFYNLSTLTRDYSAKLFQFGILLGDACGAKGKYLLEKDLGEVNYLGVEGVLYVPMYEKKFSRDEFCIEHVKTGNISDVGSFVCFSKNSNFFENSPLQFFLLSLGFIISCMFFMLTFLVYLFSPKSQNLHGKILMCYIACLFTAYLCLAIVELKFGELEKSVCTNMGYSILFSFLAAFFWLNVMSFDIWKTFRADRSLERCKTRRGNIQFFKYSLYAWTFPSLITITCAIINQTPDFPYRSLVPAMGEEQCWFSKNTKGIYLFFIAPISLIITCNIVFYVQTAWKIWKVKSDVNKVEKQRAKRFSANKDQFLINGKLFVVMGVTWSLEVVSFFAPHPIWYVTDTANALHGVFIFVIFVLKKKVLREVSRKLRIPLKTIREFSKGNSEEVFTKKNGADFQTEGKTSATLATSPVAGTPKT